MTALQERYNSLAIILHWVMALAFIMMLGSGIVLEYVDLAKDLKHNMYQWHKSGGVLLLIAFFLRIGVRLATKPPKLPENFVPWEKIAAKAGHWGLYALMFLMPFSGWVMVSSASYYIPTMVFDMFQWPHLYEISWLPFFAGVEDNEDLHEFAEEAHFFLAIALGLLIIAHVGAVVKHAVIDKENLLTRMWWSGKKQEKE